MIGTSDYGLACWLFISGNLLIACKAITWLSDLEESYRPSRIAVILIGAIVLSGSELQWLNGKKVNVASSLQARDVPKENATEGTLKPDAALVPGMPTNKIEMPNTHSEGGKASVKPTAPKPKRQPIKPDTARSISRVMLSRESDMLVQGQAADVTQRLATVWNQYWDTDDFNIARKEQLMRSQGLDISKIKKERRELLQKVLAENAGLLSDATVVQDECVKRPALADQAKRLTTLISDFYDKAYEFQVRPTQP